MLLEVKVLYLMKGDVIETVATCVVGLGPDVEQKVPLRATGRAELVRENRGSRQVVEDIRVVGNLSTEIEIRCARCLEPVDNAVSEAFDLIYRPLGVDAKSDEASICQAETEIGYYQGEGLLLEDVLKEQVLLALPAKRVCSPGCKGLCPHCGCNLNVENCSCVSTMRDPRWAELEDIRKKLERSVAEENK